MGSVQPGAWRGRFYIGCLHSYPICSNAIHGLSLAPGGEDEEEGLLLLLLLPPLSSLSLSPFRPWWNPENLSARPCRSPELNLNS